jgi:DNA-directed RNA polymerase specialized sigma24 family protein
MSIRTAARKVERAETALAAARAQLRAEIATAYKSGVSISEIGRQLGISRQRAQQIVRATLGS